MPKPNTPLLPPRPPSSLPLPSTTPNQTSLPTPTQTKLDTCQQLTTELTNDMRKNVDKVLERGARIEHLESESKRLEEQAQRFSKKSRTLRFQMCRNHYRHIFCVLVLLGILALILFLFIHFFSS